MVGMIADLPFKLQKAIATHTPVLFGTVAREGQVPTIVH